MRAFIRGGNGLPNPFAAAMTKVPGVRAEIFVPDIAESVPACAGSLGCFEVPDHGCGALMQKLRDGEPSIELVPAPRVPETIEIASWMLQPGESDIIVRRIRELLTGGSDRA